MGIAARALLHLVQSRRGRCVHYDAGMRAAVERRVALRSALKQAVEDGEGFTVMLQPKFELATGKVVSAEALLRWSHEGIAIPPSEFIPIAEATGMLERLTGFVLDTIAFYASGGREKALPVAVNLSMVDLNNPGFAARLLNQIEAAGLTSETVTFEVTEGIAMHDTPWAIQQTRALKDAGFSIALDDFGTGYSSLGHFDKLPIDTLKLDRHFVASLTVDNAQDSLAAVVIGMARTLNVACVAEGIETEEQKVALQLLGCPIGQGFLLGRPVAIEEFDERYMSPSA
jgi:EAL domain-containing protein (putative c-di-GMP-specific phosphodiesterase class I)